MNKDPLVESQHAPTLPGVEAAIVAVLLANYIIDPLVSAGIAAIALIFWIIVRGLLLPRLVLHLAVIPVGLVIVGIAMGIHHPAYDVAKDTWYFAVPAFAAAFGVVAARGAIDPRPVIMGFLASGTLLSALFLIGIATSSEIFGETTVDAIRSEVGAGYFLSVLSLLLLLTFRRRLSSFRAPIYGSVVAAAWAINGLALLLSFSRTMWFVLLIGLAMHFRLFDPRRTISWLLAVGVGAALIALPPSTADSEDDLFFSALGKVTRSLDEMIPRGSGSESDININWRGYESFMGLQTYLSGTASELIFGQGFGALVDLGFSMELGGAEFRYIPILHNAYIFLLVKVGALGLLGYLIWLYWIFGLARSGGRREARFATEASRLAQVLVVVILFTTLVVSGVFNKHDGLPLMMLVGAMLTFAVRGSQTADLRMPATPTAAGTVRADISQA